MAGVVRPCGVSAPRDRGVRRGAARRCAPAWAGIRLARDGHPGHEPDAAAPVPGTRAGMSGFFDRLIARHLESAPVRPRVASRFEARRGGLPPDAREQQVTIAASPVWGAPARTAPSAPRDEGALDAAGGALDQSVPREPRTGRLEPAVPAVRAPRRSPEGMGTPMRPS